MATHLVDPEVLFEVIDVFGKRIRTTKAYWKKIVTQKHADLTTGVEKVQDALIHPDFVYRSVTDPTIYLYRKSAKGKTLVVVAKHLNSDGFIVTTYQTSKTQIKGEQLWPK